MTQYWQRFGWNVAIRPTARADHATEIAREAAAAQHGLVLAAGGDGTLNEVANGLANSETVLVPLPVGTANSFAKELRLPRPNILEPQKLIEASDALLQGQIQRMDLGCCNDERYWLLWASTGVDGYVIDHIEPRTKLFKQLGPAGYAAKVLFFMPSYPRTRARVTIDDQVIQDDFLMINVSNVRMFGGGDFRMNAGAVLDDGLFEIWLFHGSEWAEAMRHVLQVGLENHHDDPNIDMIRGKRVQIETTPEIPYHVDGEPMAKTPFTCELRQGALRLLVPNTAPPGLFNKVGEPLVAPKH